MIKVVLVTLLFVSAGLSQTASSGMDVARDYKSSLEKLIQLSEEKIKKDSTQLVELRKLLNEGLLARRDFEQAEAALAAEKSRLQEKRTELKQSGNLLAEVTAEAEGVKLSSRTVAKSSKLTQNSVIIRYKGAGAWAIGNLTKLQSYFRSQFGQSLPTSAVGQTHTHTRMGFDHRNGVDVALHPDSAKGRALINYLQSQGIPFIAFRSAVAGSATGPHIHIGAPSRKI
jgi:uncharacterized protein YqgQ